MNGLSTVRDFCLRLRNRLSPGNRWRVDARTLLECKANVLNSKIESRGGNRIVLENGVRLRNATILLRGEGNTLWVKKGTFLSAHLELYGQGNLIEIGEKTRINGAHLIAHNGTRILIGMESLFSTGIDLRTTDSHSIFDSEGQRINPDKDIVIGNRVWLGRGVSVLKGAVIDDGCVVGAMSLVTGHLPPASLAAGIPAKVLRTGIAWRP
jgi:acetyltransferase-like isoleucine patch superfamily enzyme